MAMYEIEVNTIVKVAASNAEDAQRNLRGKLKLWLNASSIITSPATLIKKGNN